MIEVTEAVRRRSIEKWKNYFHKQLAAHLSEEIETSVKNKKFFDSVDDDGGGVIIHNGRDINKKGVTPHPTFFLAPIHELFTISIWRNNGEN